MNLLFKPPSPWYIVMAALADLIHTSNMLVLCDNHCWRWCPEVRHFGLAVPNVWTPNFWELWSWLQPRTLVLLHSMQNSLIHTCLFLHSIHTCLFLHSKCAIIYHIYHLLHYHMKYMIINIIHLSFIILTKYILIQMLRKALIFLKIFFPQS